MTNQEAIEEIKKLEYYGRPFDNSLEECNKASRKVMALNMAIKALEQNESAEEWYKLFVEKLEQEPSGDLISRQQVKSDYADWYGYGYEDNWFYKHLNNITSVNPQEPKYCDRNVFEDIKQEIWLSHKDNYCKSEIVNLINKHTKGIANGTLLKEGHWVYVPQKRMVNETDEGVEYRTEYRCKCSNCDADYGFGKMKDAYCRYCGARMVESKESEEI